jgi:hypothetical protein
MADPNDVAATKLVRRELGKRLLDLTQADLRVTHGVAYIRGVVKGMRGGNPDVKAELEIVARILRTNAHIKDVVIDCVVRS